MSLKEEIMLYAREEDRVILCWILSTYPSSRTWSFLVKCKHVRYGVYSYQTHRVYSPTPEGKILYENKTKLNLLKNTKGE